MSIFDDKAEKLADFIRISEIEDVKKYDGEQVSQAVVHGREDLVLVVSYLSSTVSQIAATNAQLKATNIMLGFILFVLCFKEMLT